MAMPDDAEFKAQLREMDDKLMSLIAIADEQGDFLLGALLCDAHAHVVRRYVALPQGS
ncbi:hypothetical protein [uncultured Sphingomonas sp.]|uniref:hypothetical protein n=1 Tax=uncultured Sphingomonas sp. TaxID=158754 RepID=UPI0035CC65BE